MSKAAVIKGGAEGLPTFASMLGPLTQRPVQSRGSMSKSQKIRSEAAEQGYQEGLKLGIEEGKALGELKALQSATEAYEQELEIFRTELTLVADRVEKALRNWCAASEEQMTDLVTVIAEKVLCSHLSLERSAVLEIVKEALDEVTHSQSAVVRVNPFDSPVLAQHREELIRSASSLRTIEFVDDPEILGGAIIETDGGRIDATVEGKLRALNSELEAA